MSDDTFRGRLRGAADPGLDPGAAERIADGAWDRAAELRAAGTGGATPGRMRRLVAPLACAAAAVIAAVVFTLRSSTPAFAVEGDPVQVLDGGRWREASRVPAGSWVFVGPRVRSELRGTGDTVIAPRPGSLFRIVATLSSRSSWHVEVRGGGAEVEGSAVVVALPDDVEVVRAGEDARFRVAVAAGETLDAPPSPADFALLRAAHPSVRVLAGLARVANLRADEVRFVGEREALAAVTVPRAGAREARFVREVQWTPDVLSDVVRGARVLSAAERPEGALALTLALGGATDPFRSVVVPCAARTDVLGQVHFVEAARAQVRMDLELRLAAAWAPTAVYELTEGDAGRRTLVQVFSDGRAELERTGEPRSRFESVEALRAARPDVAGLFGERMR